MKRTLLAIAASLCPLLGTSLALADDAPHLHGLELTLRPGVGAAPSTSPVGIQSSATAQVPDPGSLLQGTASPYGVGFVGQAMLGYRVHPLVSFGLRGGFRTTSSASSLSDGATNLSRTSWDAGLYVRAYPLALTPVIRRRLDPWVGVGVEYMRDTQSFQRATATSTGASATGDWSLVHHAVAIPIGVGVDYRLAPMFSIGPSFEYAIAVPVAACAGVSAAGFAGSNYCSNSQPGQQFIKADGYGVWSVGLDLRVTLF